MSSGDADDAEEEEPDDPAEEIIVDTLTREGLGERVRDLLP